MDEFEIMIRIVLIYADSGESGFYLSFVGIYRFTFTYFYIVTYCQSEYTGVFFCCFQFFGHFKRAIENILNFTVFL